MADCTRDEAIGIFKSMERTHLTRELQARLQTLNSADLLSLCESADVFCIIESNRRLSTALLAASTRTRRLTWVVLALSAALLVITTMPVWVSLYQSFNSRHAAAAPAPDQKDPAAAHRYTQ